MAKRPSAKSPSESGGAREPDRTQPPTAADLKSLPRWARVAFAARSARRVWARYKASWPEAHDDNVNAIDAAITAAESSALSGRRDESNAAVFAVNASNAAASNTTANAAAAAAYGAAATAAGIADSDASAIAASNAVAFVAENAASATADPISRATVISAMWHDLDRLRELAKAGKWTNDTSIPASFFAEPLWPHRSPKGWPNDKARMNVTIDSRSPSALTELVEATQRRVTKLEDLAQTLIGVSALRSDPALEVYIDPGENSKEEVRDLLLAISDIHRAAGGLGLQFKRQGQKAYIVVGAEA